MAADPALFTFAAGLEIEVIQSAGSQITDAFTGLF
jgi:hypothetical protein